MIFFILTLFIDRFTILRYLITILFENIVDDTEKYVTSFENSMTMQNILFIMNACHESKI